MAFWMDQVARGWLIYELTESAFQLGLVRGVQAIPILLLSPVAGTTADRYSRKTQIFVAQIVDGLMLSHSLCLSSAARFNLGTFTRLPSEWRWSKLFSSPPARR